MRYLAIVTVCMVGLAAYAGSLRAQEEFHPPQCELDQGHFLVSQASTYLQGAVEEEDPAKSDQLLADAKRSLLEALDRGEMENAAVWYYLSRVYVREGDAAGADTALTRALELAPDCADDLDFYRRRFWVTLINAGMDSLRAGAFEGAKAILREASHLVTDDNITFYYLGRLFANEGQADSALRYFKRVASLGVPDSADRQEFYDESITSIARLYELMARREDSPAEWDSAAVWWGTYRERHPADAEAMVSQASAYWQAGNRDRAMMMYDSVFANASEMSAQDLFRVGETLFLGERFEEAARAFRLGVEKIPFHRNGLYNLANTYLSLASDEGRTRAQRREAARNMEAVARRLIEVDPQNEEARRLLGAAFQLQDMDDSSLAVVRRVDRMQFDVKVDDAQPMNGGFAVQGRIVNLKEQATEVPALTFEFLDAEGNVVSTDTVDGQTLQPTGSVNFAATARGEGIIAWRYRVGT